MSHPLKVSVIIPVYNVEEYIKPCINSLLEQNYNHLECLFINDRSTDKSQSIIDEFLEKYNGKIIFRTIFHKENKGLSAARNTGIMNAQGDYILFLDSDDMLLPNALENLIGVAKKFNLPDLVVGDIFSESEYYLATLAFPRNKIYPDFTEDSTWISENFLLNVKVIAWNKLSVAS